MTFLGAILFVLITMIGPVSGAHFNPAVTIARSMTDTFSGIATVNAPGFILMQFAGAAIATGFMAWLLRPSVSNTHLATRGTN